MKHRICPVIHVETADQLERNLEVAKDAQVDGVFLINHDIPAADLVYLFRDFRPLYPELWFGLNLLGPPPHLAARCAIGADGLWMDGVPKKPLGLDIPVFGGVAFKYQYTHLTLEEEARQALPLVDVVVTSGPATGKAATTEKVEALKTLLGDKPLGLASGLTPENVGSYLPWVEWLLVATGVSKDFANLCPDKLRDFVAAVRQS